MFGPLICFFRGHKRGKRIPMPAGGDVHRTYYACGRCGRVKSYKHKPASPAIAPQQHPASPAASTTEYLAEERRKLHG